MRPGSLAKEILQMISTHYPWLSMASSLCIPSWFCSVFFDWTCGTEWMNSRIYMYIPDLVQRVSFKKPSRTILTAGSHIRDLQLPRFIFIGTQELMAGNFLHCHVEVGPNWQICGAVNCFHLPPIYRDSGSQNPQRFFLPRIMNHHIYIYI